MTIPTQRDRISIDDTDAVRETQKMCDFLENAKLDPRIVLGIALRLSQMYVPMTDVMSYVMSNEAKFGRNTMKTLSFARAYAQPITGKAV